MVQNGLHPKNTQRREAIANNEYQPIRNNEEADAFLESLLRKTLTVELKAKQGDALQQVESIRAKNAAELFAQAPDIYMAATIMIKNQFFQGKGDLQKIYEAVAAKPKECPALGEKFKLLHDGFFHGSKLLKDNFKNYPQGIVISKKNQFLLWFNLVRLSQVLTNQQFIELFPYTRVRALLWDDVVDMEGKQTLNGMRLNQYNRQRQLEKKKR